MSINKWLIENLFFKETKNEKIESLREENKKLVEHYWIMRKHEDLLYKKIEEQKDQIKILKEKNKLLLATHGEKTKRKM